MFDTLTYAQELQAADFTKDRANHPNGQVRAGAHSQNWRSRANYSVLNNVLYWVDGSCLKFCHPRQAV